MDGKGRFVPNHAREPANALAERAASAFPELKRAEPV
jgi:hypothetical protein